jgi:hypothetical protein
MPASQCRFPRPLSLPALPLCSLDRAKQRDVMQVRIQIRLGFVGLKFIAIHRMCRYQGTPHLKHIRAHRSLTD